jgi:hypothetical protein
MSRSKSKYKFIKLLETHYASGSGLHLLGLGRARVETLGLGLL